MSTLTLSAEAAPRPRSRILAAVLTLLAPGVGHLYIGQRRRALILVLINFVLGAAYLVGAFLLPPPFLPIGIFGLSVMAVVAVYYIGCVIDAVRLARRPDAAPPVRWYLLLGAVLAIGGAAVLAIWGANTTIQLSLPDFRQLTAWRIYSVPSTSMQPTLRIGERFVANSRYYASHAPARGEVVTYVLPGDDNTIYVKRIVALPGERIAFRANRAVVNGVVQSEPFADLSNDSAFYATMAEVTVPPGHIFVVGDNRANSSDSRVAKHGFVPIGNLTGRAIAIMLSGDIYRFGLWIGTPLR